MSGIKLAGKWNPFIKKLEESYYNNEIKNQDQSVLEANKILKQQGYPVGLDDSVSFFLNESTGNPEPRYVPKSKATSPTGYMPSPETLNNLKNILGVNYSQPVTNEWLNNKTAEEFIKDEQLRNAGGFFPGLMKVLGKRAYKFGEQFADNLPGLSSIGSNPITKEEDPLNNMAGAAIQSGGRVMPILGAAWMGINAGNTRAGTLDEARRLGVLK